MDAMKNIGDKAIHIFNPDIDPEISSSDAILLKEVIEDFFNVHFEEAHNKSARRTQLAKRAEEINELAIKIETSHD